MNTATGVHEKGTFTVLDAIKNIKADPNYHKTGAIALFIGVVRGETLENEREKVEKIIIEAYDEKANETLAKIRSDLMQKHGITNIQIHHLQGKFEVGDDLVYVAVAGAHRTDVFPVLHEAVERYKKEAPIFKKEYITNKQGKSSGYWVSEKHSH